jgi:hypothetical protein
VDLVELTTTFFGVSPNAALIALLSFKSPKELDVRVHSNNHLDGVTRHCVTQHRASGPIHIEVM